MSSNPRTHLEALLSCGCTIIYKVSAPRKGDRVICRKHWSGGTVIEVKGQWSLSCRTCRLNRTYGANSVAAFSTARRHANTTGHTVRVWRVGDSENDHEISPVISGQQGLPF